MVFLGAVIGFAGWWLHPLRRAGRVARAPAASVWIAMVAGVLATVVARMLGHVVGVFHDGDTLEWPVCTAVALAAVAAVGMLSRRR